MPKTELLEIKVDEISLVDDPAVEEDFIVIKNKSGKKKSEEKEVPESSENFETSSGGENPEVPVKKQPEELPPENEGETSSQDSGMTMHETLKNEILSAISEAGKQIWAKAPTLNISDDEEMMAFKEKVWMIDDLCWQLRSYKNITSLAKSATEKAEKGDATGAMDSIAKLLKNLGESTVLQKENKNKTDENSDNNEGESPIGQRFKVKMIDQGVISRLVEGLMITREALDGVDAGSLSEMLQSLMGQGPAQEEVEQVSDEMKAKANKKAKAEAQELKALRAELSEKVKKLKKLEEKDAKRSNTIRPSNGLSAEINRANRVEEEPVIWGDDLAASRD